MSKIEKKLKFTGPLCPVYGERKLVNGKWMREIKSYRIWCFWEDGDWTAETLKSFDPKSKIIKDIHRKILHGHEVDKGNK